jgi:hypothetical protein
MAVNLPITNTSYQKSPISGSWVRPSDWITITDNVDEFQALVADTGDATYTLSYVITGTGNTTINWGDGTTTIISGASTSTSTKTYTIGGGTPCSRGYTTFKIRITKDTGITIGSMRFIASAASFQNSWSSCGVLEVYYGDNIQTSTNPDSFFSSGQGTNSLLSFMMMEYVKLPATVSWTSMNYVFFTCTNLAKVVMPTSASSLQTMIQTFAACPNLRTISLPSNATSITDMTSTFINCITLRSVTLPTTLNSCTLLTTTFSGCRYLQSVTLPSINSCINVQSLFQNCISLLWVKFISLPSPASPSTSITATNFFFGCSSLQYVYLPATCSANAVYTFTSAFNSCWSLRNISFPTNFDTSVMDTAFSGCYNLYSVIFQSAMPNCTSFSSTFLNCQQLQKITLPSSTSSSGITLANAFQNCYSLSSITIPTTYVITSLASTFNTCTIIRSITINSVQNSCTTLANAFQTCSSLVSLTLPTSLNTCTTLASAFSSCTSLTSITDYGYAGHLDDPYNAGADLNFGVPKEINFTLASGLLSNNLYNTYYSPYFAEITDKDSRLVTCKMKFTERNINTLDFTKFIWVDGVLYRLYKIVDYSENELCEVQLLRVIYTTY